MSICIAETRPMYFFIEEMSEISVILVNKNMCFDCRLDEGQFCVMLLGKKYNITLNL